jgi:aldehyde:ferredoxin oxidoreductase
LWIDLTSRLVEWEKRPEEFFRRFAGGGLLATRLLMESTKAGVDPLGPENLLIFASSVVAGLPGPGLARFTVAAKSPLTRGIGETRCEGPWGVALKNSGADAIVMSGAAPKPVVVAVEGGEVRFLEASHMWGRTTGETAEEIERQFGTGVHVAAIGPAGERGVRFASIVADRTFQAARMGMGAVMGSKNLKAVVLAADRPPAIADAAAMEKYSLSFTERIPGNALSRWQKEPPGFSCWVQLHGVDAALCVNNYSRSTIGGTERLSKEESLKRHCGVAACPGCANDCVQILHPAGQAADARASGIHQEITGALGPNIGVTDLDWILRMNNYANQQGLDPTSLGYVVSFAMELREQGIVRSGVPGFGDTEGAERLIRDIAGRRDLGDTLAEGVRLAADTLGSSTKRYAMHVKGLEMVCFEPRTQTGLALGYATAPIGPRYDIAEHDWDFDTRCGWEHSLHLTRTLGIDSRIPMGDLSAEKVRRYKLLNTLWSAADALDFCIFAIAPVRALSLPEMAGMVQAATGWETSDFELMRWGERRNQIMRLYNLRERLTAADDTLPDRFFDEAVPEGPRKGDRLHRGTFHAAVRTYYSLMGWDENGVPTGTALLDNRLTADGRG